MITKTQALEAYNSMKYPNKGLLKKLLNCDSSHIKHFDFKYEDNEQLKKIAIFDNIFTPTTYNEYLYTNFTIIKDQEAEFAYWFGRNELGNKVFAYLNENPNTPAVKLAKKFGLIPRLAEVTIEFFREKIGYRILFQLCSDFHKKVLLNSDYNAVMDLVKRLTPEVLELGNKDRCDALNEPSYTAISAVVELKGAMESCAGVEPVIGYFTWKDLTYELKNDIIDYHKTYPFMPFSLIAMKFKTTEPAIRRLFRESKLSKKPIPQKDWEKCVMFLHNHNEFNVCQSRYAKSLGIPNIEVRAILKKNGVQQLNRKSLKYANSDEVEAYLYEHPFASVTEIKDRFNVISAVYNTAKQRVIRKLGHDKLTKNAVMLMYNDGSSIETITRYLAVTREYVILTIVNSLFPDFNADVIDSELVERLTLRLNGDNVDGLLGVIATAEDVVSGTLYENAMAKACYRALDMQLRPVIKSESHLFAYLAYGISPTRASEHSIIPADIINAKSKMVTYALMKAKQHRLQSDILGTLSNHIRIPKPLVRHFIKASDHAINQHHHTKDIARPLSTWDSVVYNGRRCKRFAFLYPYSYIVFKEGKYKRVRTSDLLFRDIE